MAMTKREKVLAIAVGGIVGLLGLQFMINSVRSGIEAKERTLEAVKKKIDGHNRLITDYTLANKRLIALKGKSLPNDDEAAQNQYSTWIREMAESAGLQNIQLDNPAFGGGRSEAFTVYRVQLKGDSRIDDLLKLLYKFYDRDYLHRIQSLKVTQFPNDPDRATVVLVSEVIALKNAAPKQPPSLASSGRMTKSMDEYLSDVLERNPFGPPNRAPAFAVEATHDVPREREWSLELKANDPDGRHRVQYQLLSEKPEGLQFSESSGKITWTPKANGNYDLIVQAVDSGLPPKKSQQKLVLKVVDPPPPPTVTATPQFDAASQSFVSAILSGRDGAQVWIRTKTDNNTYKVGAGDEISIGTVKGKIVEVNVDSQFVEIETDGRRWTFGMDDSLQAAYKRSLTN